MEDKHCLFGGPKCGKDDIKHYWRCKAMEQGITLAIDWMADQKEGEEAEKDMKKTRLPKRRRR